MVLYDSRPRSSTTFLMLGTFFFSFLGRVSFVEKRAQQKHRKGLTERLWEKQNKTNEAKTFFKMNTKENVESISRVKTFEKKDKLLFCCFLKTKKRRTKLSFCLFCRKSRQRLKQKVNSNSASEEKFFCCFISRLPTFFKNNFFSFLFQRNVVVTFLRRKEGRGS